MTALGIILITIGCVSMIASSYFALNFASLPLVKCGFSCSQISYIFLFISIAVAIMGFAFLIASFYRKNSDR